jgi:hypothetical protein
MSSIKTLETKQESCQLYRPDVDAAIDVWLARGSRSDRTGQGCAAPGLLCVPSTE